MSPSARPLGLPPLGLPAVRVLVVPADVRHLDPPHQPPQRDVGPRPDDQMPVVGHEAVSQQSHRKRFSPSISTCSKAS
jgi:hypothetical protein